MRSVNMGAVAVAIIALFASGCASPVGVSRLDEQSAQRKLTANVLSSDTPSAYSMQILRRAALDQRYKKEPEAVLTELRSGLGKPDERDRLFALAELSFAHAEASHNRSHYLASAVYGYALPIVAGVHVHSIIAVKGSGPIASGNDGVVEYQSAHIEGVESELVVHSGHSTQVTPETIEEVRRMLYEHAGVH